MDTPVRGRNPEATRARIAETALDLFESQGYAQTTIDQIAVAAGVGRRTVFRYFATKQAIIFDQLVVRREVAIQRLRERPSSEPPLVSLHAVLRELSTEGYDRRLLAQIRAVMATEPLPAGEQLSGDFKAFESAVTATLQSRLGEPSSQMATLALTRMACGWFMTAAHIYLTEARPSLVECFDEIVAICVQSGTRDLDGFVYTIAAPRVT